MLKHKRKILFITERRADYSRLKPIMRGVKNSRVLELKLLVTGAHLLKGFGETKRVIAKDGFRIDATVPMFSPKDGDDGVSMVKAMGRCMMGLADAIEKIHPDVVFCGFDLGAHLASAIVAAHLNIPIAHIQGGEVSGTIDEVLRHACTKFAHLHFAATKDSVKRIIRLGEDPKYVYLVGSPSLDTIHGIVYPSKQEICRKFGLDPSKKLAILLQHTVTTEVDDVERQISQTISALRSARSKHDLEILAVYSNNDAGGKRIVRALERSGIKVFPHIVYEDFLRILNVADVLVGNSSTGIHESPSFGLPTVNIGTRQQHRERGKNVIDVPTNRNAILAGLERALGNKKFIQTARRCKNPYDQGPTAKRIVKILETVKFPPVQKVICY